MSTNHQVTISSNTLFHFTDKIENVINILENEFMPHFCLEDLSFMLIDISPLEKLEIAIPMVCFCDIPLSQSRAHMENYGKYGIGLSKKWGIKNKICPILYAHDNSAITFSINEMQDKILSFGVNTIFNKQTDSDFIGKFLGDLYWISSFVKPYDGILSKNGKEVRFYDEREWRYVPKLPDEFSPLRLTKAQYSDPNMKSSAIEKLRENSILKFEPSDIKYIIVQKEDEIIEIIKEIERIKIRYDDNQKKLLCSRVISSDQILEDF
jgi:hypothetical protein